jgi:acyl-CoA hydrolase
METYAIVRPEHLNAFGNLFGGQMLRWVDEYAWIAAVHDFPYCSLVTRALDKVEFRTGVKNGAILRFEVTFRQRGHSSASYQVKVFSKMPETDVQELVFTTTITFVCVDQNGEKRALPDSSSCG